MGDQQRFLLLATRNKGKVREIRGLLKNFPLYIKSLQNFPHIPPAKENGRTFQANAIKKARHYQAFTGVTTLADDSGLEVDALNRAPGIFSARFAGEKATDAQNNHKLLKEMKNLPREQRKARFRCVVAIALPGGIIRLAQGSCEGYILEEFQGEEGFGYDPLFYYPPAGKTFAQMSAREKNLYSHRAQALVQARKILKDIFT